VFPEVGNGLAYDGAFLFSDSHATDGGPALAAQLEVRRKLVAR
jgi:hypothetical protein